MADALRMLGTGLHSRSSQVVSGINNSLERAMTSSQRSASLEEDAALHTAGKMAASSTQDASQVEDRGSLLHPPPPSFSQGPTHTSPSALSSALTPTTVRELKEAFVGPRHEADIP